MATGGMKGRHECGERSVSLLARHGLDDGSAASVKVETVLDVLRFGCGVLGFDPTAANDTKAGVGKR